MKLVRGLRKALTIAEREDIADHAVRRLAAKREDPWKAETRSCRRVVPQSATARRRTGTSGE
jgi:hypothetical protein